MRTRIVAAACVLTLAGMGAAVAGPGPEPPEIEPHTAAGSAPQASVGQHRLTIPADETERYLRIPRRTDENLLIVARAFPDLADERDGFDLALLLPDGETECHTDSALTTTNKGRSLVAAVGLEAVASKRSEGRPEDNPCSDSEDLLLQVNRDTVSGTKGSTKSLPVDLTVTLEPPAGETPHGPAATEDIAPLPLPIKDDEEIKPGTTAHTAAPLGPDTGTKLEVTPGTTAYYKVRVGWNQRLDAKAQVPANGSGFTLDHTLNVDLDILNPQGIAIGVGEDSTELLISGVSSDSEHVGQFTAPVRSSNRDAGLSSESDNIQRNVRWTTQPGWYVVSLRVSPQSRDDLPKDPKPVPALLTVQVSGDAAMGPTFTSGGQQVAAPPTGRISGEVEDTGPLGLVVKGGLTVVVIAALGAVLVWSRRV